MSYRDQIQDLIELTRAGADPMDALSQFQALEADRAARMKARKQAEREAAQDALDFLSKNAFAAAGDPSTLQDVTRLSKAYGSFATQNVPDALSTLFAPTGESRIGTSTGGLWETSPLLDVADRRNIDAEVKKLQAAGNPINQIRSSIHSEFATDPSYDYNDDLQETIDMLIRKALGG